jgi:hypothetical protein
MLATSKLTKTHAALIAILLAAATAALAVVGSGSTPASSRPEAAGAPPQRSPVVPDSPAVTPPAATGNAPGKAASSAGRAPLVATDESSAEAASTSTASTSSSSSGGSSFAKKYPAQANASVDPSVPATNYWALLIGINDYAGSTRDNVGSYQDARELRKHLLSLGWHSDHIALIGNRDATATRIIQGIRWLASKTDSSSVVVFHYAGHEKPLKTSSDGDNESRDVALWVADNKLIVDGKLGSEMGKVAAAKMWIDLAVCRAGGFSDSGMVKSGRILTYSSPESELSYEDPGLHHSVFGWYVIMEGMRQRLGDLNGDGIVTVEEAYKYARPYVVDRTGGRQHPKITDKLSGELNLTPPKPAPPPEQPPPDDGSGGGCGIVIFCTEAYRSQYWA